MHWNRLSKNFSLLAAAIGAIGLAGWVFKVDALTRIHPTLVTMKANAAISLILAGIALSILSDDHVKGIRRSVARTFGVMIGLVGVITMGEHFCWWEFGFDQALFHESIEGAARSFPGRMGIASAANFILLGLGIFFVDRSTRREIWPGQICAFGVITLTSLIFLIYFYQVELPPPLAPYLSIALHTVVAFFLLASAMLLARPERGVMAVFLADNASGIIARRALPAALLVPGLLGWLCTLGRDAGYFGRGLEIALLASALTLIFTAIVWWAARSLATADAKRRDAEAARAQLAAIVQFSKDAILSKDLNGVITSWNAGAQELFGYTAAEMVGQPVIQIIPTERRTEEAGILRRLRAGEAIEHYETVRVAKDGRLLSVSLSISPLRDETGVIFGASKIVRDITQRKASEEALAQARDEADAANRAKDDFLAVLSHELRTPLNPALMAASDLESSLPTDRDAIRESVALIRRNIELEARLVDDLLDLTRISRGKLRIASAPVDIQITLRDALAIAEPMLREKSISVVRELEATDHLVRGDAARLAQVFSNLLTNAAKFTPQEGRVTIRSATDRDGALRVEICDTGIGIAPKVLPKIFDAFRQGGDGTTRRYGGLGLGLSVAKSLVEAHGGRIAASSPGRDRGATFTVTFPVSPIAPAGQMKAAPPTAPTSHGRRLRVLIVEDHDDTRTVLRRLIERWGHHPRVAASVAEARALLTSETFDLLLSDVGLPDGTGLDVVRTLRERSDIPAVAMSGYGMDADLARARQAGFTEHLVKPVAAERLRAVLDRAAAPPDASARRD